jgi:transcriptional regulator with XRE-family HTH domain
VAYTRTFSPEALRQARRRAGLTQVELERLMRSGSNYVSAIECGAKTPRADSLARMADVLDIAIDDLFERQRVKA